MITQMAGRTSIALSNLRGVVIVLILAFHSFSAYIVTQPSVPPPFDDAPYSWTAFPIIDRERWIGFDLFCAFVFLYLMQLMFFLSGLFVWPSLLRRGSSVFLARRLIRLGLPFLIGIYLLMPITFYAVYRVTAADPAWSTFWAHWTALPISATGPMWFLWFLLVLDVAATILLLGFRALMFNDFVEKIVTDPLRSFLVLTSISAVLYLPLAAIFSPWQWVGYGPFEIQAAFAPQYALYFAFGVAVGVFGLEKGLLDPNGRLVQRWTFWLLCSIASFLLWIIPTALIVKDAGNASIERLAADLSLVVFCLCGVLWHDVPIAEVWHSSLVRHRSDLAKCLCDLFFSLHRGNLAAICVARPTDTGICKRTYCPDWHPFAQRRRKPPNESHTWEGWAVTK
jgi:hypothetical protein